MNSESSKLLGTRNLTTPNSCLNRGHNFMSLSPVFLAGPAYEPLAVNGGQF
jgi:hypothetical protein